MQPVTTASESRVPPAAGADVGSTLLKLALRDARGRTTTATLPSDALDTAAERIAALGPACVGITGGGAPRLAARIGSEIRAVVEFEAWAAGARLLLAREGERPERFLLVSLGTGTSVLLVEPGGATRVGGTALGGGTVVGLGAALTGERGFAALARLAEAGDRSRVDLRVADIDPERTLPLPGEMNASSFAKLARGGAPPAEPADLAHGIMGLVGENVGLICAGIATRLGVERIVFGGSTLRANPTLTAVLAGVCLGFGHSPRFLADGEYAGALGALALGESAG